MNDQTNVDALIEQLKNDEAETRRAAARKLRKIRDIRAVEPLVAALRDEDELVRLSVAKTLGIIGDAHAVEPLIAMLRDEDIRMRYVAASALGKIGDSRAIEPLADALQDSRTEVRHSAVKALRMFGSAEVIELLGDALQDDNETIRRSAIEGLAEIGGGQVIEFLISALQDDDDAQVRRTAIMALREIGGQQVVESLIFALQDSDTQVRKNAAEGLGQELGGTGTAHAALDPLIKALQDKDENVRCAAARALGRIGDACAVKPLIAALQDDIEVVHYMAVRALGWIRDAGAVEPLISILQNDNERTRFLAAEALGKIGDPHAIEPLGVLLDDEVSRTRRSAIRSLKWIGGFQAFATLANVLLDNPHPVYNTLHYWSDDLPGASKAEYIAGNVLVNSSAVSTRLRPSLIFRAMLSSSKGKDEVEKEKDRNEICKILIKEATSRKADVGMISVLADLLCYGAPGRDKAADMIELYQREHNISPEDLDLLRKYVGGERALEPILAQLQSNLDEHFLEPIDELNKITLTMWEDTVKQAKRGFDTRLYMSIVIFVIGSLASVAALYQFTFGNLDRLELFLGPGVALATGMASMAATFFFGPLREIQQSVTDLSVVHTAFIGLIHRVLEISQTFAALVLQQKMDFSEVGKSNELIKDAMAQTLEILRPETAKDMKARIPEISAKLGELE